MKICKLYFHLGEEEDIFVNNHKGFTLLEVLVATTIIFMLITTLIPLTTLLTKERKLASENLILANMLHDELQPFLWNNKSAPKQFQKKVNSKKVIFSFTREDDFIKGCVKWTNVKNKGDSICLYGLPQE